MGIFQPGNGAAMNQAVHDYRKGKGFNMMTKDLATILHLVCFGGQCSHGNEVWLHLYLGKMFAGDFCNEQMQAHALWSVICLGHRLLPIKICPIL
jgi:hypothetical protein